MINVTFKLPNETTQGINIVWYPESVHITGKNNGVSFNMGTDFQYDFEEKVITVSVPDGFELNDWALNSASIGNIDTSREISDDGNVLEYTMSPKDDAIHSLTDVWDLSKARLSHDPYNEEDALNLHDDVKFRLNNIHQPDAYNIQIVLVDSYQLQFIPRQDPSGVVTPTDLAPVIYVDENKKVQVKHDATIASNNGVLSAVGTTQQQGMVTLTSTLVEPQAFKFTVTNTSNQTLDRVAISVEAVNYIAHAKQIPDVELIDEIYSDGSVELTSTGFFVEPKDGNASKGVSFYVSSTALPPNGTVSFNLRTNVQTGLVTMLSNAQVWDANDSLLQSVDNTIAYPVATDTNMLRLIWGGAIYENNNVGRLVVYEDTPDNVIATLTNIGDSLDLSVEQLEGDIRARVEYDSPEYVYSDPDFNGFFKLLIDDAQVATFGTYPASKSGEIGEVEGFDTTRTNYDRWTTLTTHPKKSSSIYTVNLSVIDKDTRESLVPGWILRKADGTGNSYYAPSGEDFNLPEEVVETFYDSVSEPGGLAWSFYPTDDLVRHHYLQEGFKGFAVDFDADMSIDLLAYNGTQNWSEYGERNTGVPGSDSPITYNKIAMYAQEDRV